ncbi:hypothetical protein PtB15_7B634 [Puccinia triticina]|nr:hypothetical protein PtB15_7B634 [Puccinia triticina]
MSTLIRDVLDRDEAGRYHSFLTVCEAGHVSEIREVVETAGGLASLSLQDDDGWTALHYAASSGNADGVKYLLEKGALWAMTDNLGYNAGDVAYSMNHGEIYQIISSHGFRAEVLRLAIEAKEDGGEGTRAPQTSASSSNDNASFLASKLTFKTSSSGQRLCVDSEGNGVMQGWETELMRATARGLCGPFGETSAPGFELSVLNVGFGLGIIDGFLQEYRPTRHLIVEPHPDVLQFISDQGWLEKKGVTVYPRRWQDFLLDVQNGTIQANFDAIYWDTFSEDYRSLKSFFDNVFDLLSGPHARFSWFHGAWYLIWAGLLPSTCRPCPPTMAPIYPVTRVSFFFRSRSHFAYTV